MPISFWIAVLIVITLALAFLLRVLVEEAQRAIRARRTTRRLWLVRVTDTHSGAYMAREVWGYAEDDAAEAARNAWAREGRLVVVGAVTATSD